MPPSGFDRIAPVYRWLEYVCFGRQLQTCRTRQMHRIPERSQALVLGDGDGRFTAALLQQRSLVHVVAVDSSPAMLALLAGRVRSIGASERLTIVEGDAVELLHVPLGTEKAPEAIASRRSGEASRGKARLAAGSLHVRGQLTSARPAESFDFACTHFFLDCLATPDVQCLARDIRLRLRPEATWIVSEFATPHAWAKLIVALLYRAFGLLCGLKVQQLPAWREALLAEGFSCVVEEQLLGGLLTASAWRAPGRAP